MFGSLTFLEPPEQSTFECDMVKNGAEVQDGQVHETLEFEVALVHYMLETLSNFSVLMRNH